jgi:hypothetical protein
MLFAFVANRAIEPVPPAPSSPVDDVIGQLERLGKLRTDA